MQNPPIRLIRECFDYCAETGVISWKSRPVSHFRDANWQKRFNTRFAGKVAVSATREDGRVSVCYRNISFSGYHMGAHRLALLLSGFKLPKGSVVDHINGDGLDNRLRNLRVTTPQKNFQNCKKSKNNTSGHTGIYKRRNKWVALIGVDGRLVYLGIFANIEDAIACRAKAERENGFTERHGK